MYKYISFVNLYILFLFIWIKRNVLIYETIHVNTIIKAGYFIKSLSEISS